MTPRAETARSRADQGVLIVGGYGNVGRRIARLLADRLGERLFISGRHASRAARFAKTLGGGVRSRTINLELPDTYAPALADVVLVIMCLDTEDLKFAHACIAEGVHYVDITASHEVIERLGFMNDLACAHSSTIVTSVGLAPGLTNLLAKHSAQATDARRLDIHVLFGLGDRHGKAALEWMVDRLHRPFEISTMQGTRVVRAFEERSHAQFPPPFGERTTYGFDFSDQHTLPETLAVPSVSTWTTYDKAWVARLLSRLAIMGVLRWTRYRFVRHCWVLILGALRCGSDRFAVSVEATDAANERHKIRLTASGTQEAHATAVVAAETAMRVLTSGSPAGVFQLDQLYDLSDFEPTLAANGIEIGRPSSRTCTDVGQSSASTVTPFPNVTCKDSDDDHANG